jgi:glutathione S-transferase
LLTLYYGCGACSMAPHIVLEESGEKYTPHPVDLAKGEQRSEAYLKINPRSRVPALGLDDGSVLTENTAILPFLGKRFGLFPKDALGEARTLSTIGYFAATVHPANTHVMRAERFATDPATHANIKETGRNNFHTYLKEIDGMLAGREWLGKEYSVIDPYAFVFYTWGIKRELPVKELKNYTAFAERMAKRPAVQRVMEDEKVTL